MPTFTATFDKSSSINTSTGERNADTTPAATEPFGTGIKTVSFKGSDYFISISKSVVTKASGGEPKTEPSKMSIIPEMYLEEGDKPIPDGVYVYDTDNMTLTEKNAVPDVQVAQEAGPPALPTLEPFGGDVTLDPIYTTILGGMNSVLTSLTNADGGDKNKLGDFSVPNGKFYVELDGYVTLFKTKPTTEIVYQNPISERNNAWTPQGKVVNPSILKVIAGKASKDEIDKDFLLKSGLDWMGVRTPIDGIPQAIEKLASENETFKDFLILGRAGSLDPNVPTALDSNRATMYKNLAGFITLLGAKTEFESVIDKINEPETKKPDEPEPAPGGKTAGSDASGDKTATVNPPPAGAGAGAGTGTGTGAGAGAASPSENEQTKKAVDMGEAPKKEAPSDTVLFRYTLFGADPDSTAQMRLIFNDGSALDYEIPAERIGSVNTFIVNGNNRDKIKANIDTYVDVKITAKPMGGGEDVIDKQSVYITKQLADNQIFSYRFMPSLGWRKNTGVDSRGKTVGELISNQGNVRMVFYTRSGSVSVAMCDVSTSVSGKMFKFNFTGDQPLLVPIQLDVTPGLLSESFIKKARRMLNEAVPHWIFLKPGAAAAGGAGGGGGGGKGKGGAGGGGGGGKQKMNVNIAVSQIMIATDEKWIFIPNVGNPFNRESFKFAVAQGSIQRYSAIPDTATQVTLAADELSKQGYTQQQITDKVYETLFEDSAAWKQVGGPNLNCWSKDDTVVGGSSSITSRHAYEPVRVS